LFLSTDESRNSNPQNNIRAKSYKKVLILLKKKIRNNTLEIEEKIIN